MGQFPEGHKQKQFSTSIKILKNVCYTFQKKNKKKYIKKPPPKPTNQQLIITFRLENIEMNVYSLLTATRTQLAIYEVPDLYKYRDLAVMRSNNFPFLPISCPDTLRC